MEKHFILVEQFFTYIYIIYIYVARRITNIKDARPPTIEICNCKAWEGKTV